MQVENKIWLNSNKKNKKEKKRNGKQKEVQYIAKDFWTIKVYYFTTVSLSFTLLQPNFTHGNKFKRLLKD